MTTPRFAATQVYIHAMWLDNESHGAAWKDTYYAVVPPQSSSKVPLAEMLTAQAPPGLRALLCRLTGIRG